MKTTREILIGARRRIADIGWTQGYMAADKNGKRVRATDPSAVCYCAFGAVLAAGDVNETAEEEGRAITLLDISSQNFGVDFITTFNDTFGRTKEEVLAVFDRAIELASA